MNSLIPLLFALVQSAPAPEPKTAPAAPAPRAVSVFEVADSSPRRDETSRSAAAHPLEISRVLLSPLVGELSPIADASSSATPGSRLLAALVEEGARAFDPTARCRPRGAAVVVESAPGGEVQKRIADLMEQASAATRDRTIALELRFLEPGPRSVQALARAGLRVDALDGGARVQETTLSRAEINELLAEDGEAIKAPDLSVGSAQRFSAETHRPVYVVTDYDPLPIEELGTVLSPRTAELKDGIELAGYALALPLSSARSGDRIAVDLELGASRVERPIPTEERTVAGRTVQVQLPKTRRNSLQVLFTLGVERRVIVAGLAQPSFDGGAGRPILLEIVAKTMPLPEHPLQRR